MVKYSVISHSQGTLFRFSAIRYALAIRFRFNTSLPLQDFASASILSANTHAVYTNRNEKQRMPGCIARLLRDFSAPDAGD
jgi:hypothetical protein